MQTIILAAGNNERFEGKHKSALESPNSKSFLENQVETLDSDPLVFIAQKKYAEELRVPISELSYIGGNARTIVHVWLSEETTGPLDTLYKAKHILNFLHEDQPVLIAYCDVLLSRKHAVEFIEKCNEREAGIVVFPSDDERFQDAITGHYKNSGLFYFRSARELAFKIELLSEHQRGATNGIPDLVYKTVMPVMFVLKEEDIVDIGTPESYKEWING